MANRVLLDASGLKVSKPGVNVLTAGDAGLLFDTNTPMLQVIASGGWTGVAQGATRTATLPALDFTPFVFVYSPDNVARANYSGGSVTFSAVYGGTWSVYYAVMNIPRGG